MKRTCNLWEHHRIKTYKSRIRTDTKQKLEQVPEGTNTPGRRHLLMYKNNLSVWQWYKAKSMDHALVPIYFTRLIFETHWSFISITTFLHQIDFKIWRKQNQRTIKYRSLFYRCSGLRSRGFQVQDLLKETFAEAKLYCIAQNHLPSFSYHPDVTKIVLKVMWNWQFIHQFGMHTLF